MCSTRYICVHHPEIQWFYQAISQMRNVGQNVQQLMCTLMFIDYFKRPINLNTKAIFNNKINGIVVVINLPQFPNDVCVHNKTAKLLLTKMQFSSTSSLIKSRNDYMFSV